MVSPVRQDVGWPVGWLIRRRSWLRALWHRVAPLVPGAEPCVLRQTSSSSRLVRMFVSRLIVALLLGPECVPDFLLREFFASGLVNEGFPTAGGYVVESSAAVGVVVVELGYV